MARIITRTASLGSLDFALTAEMVDHEKEQADMVDVVVSVSSSKSLRRASCSEPVAAKSPKKTFLRLHVATPPRAVCVLLLFLFNIVPVVAASFLSLSVRSRTGKERTNALHTAVASPSLVPPARHVLPRLAMTWPKSLGMAWAEHEMPSGPSETLRECSEALSEGSAALKKTSHELAHKVASLERSVASAAQAELSKLKQQMAIADAHLHQFEGGMGEPSTCDAPNMAVAAAAIGVILPQLLKEDDDAAASPPTDASAAPSAAAAAATSAAATSAVTRARARAAAQLGRLFARRRDLRSASLDLPAGFSLGVALRTAELCLYAYRGCKPKAKDGSPTHVEELEEELGAVGLTLVREVQSTRLDTYAMIARSDDAVYVVFRGSTTLKNLHVDLRYHVADEQTMEEYSHEAAMTLPAGLQVHSGFLDAWRSLRAEVLETLEEICNEESLRTGSDARSLRLVVSGHSMGGALAMFASLELASRMNKRSTHPFTRGHVTYTFAAPRVGNAKFARLCDLTFPKPSQLWALQRSNDAVPHLPFAAWGFRHPHGVAFLDPPGGDAAVAEGAAESTGSDQASGEAEAAAEEEKKEFDLWARQPEGVPTSIAHSGDRGDDVLQLRPFQGKAHHWASYHHIFAYLEPLQKMLHVHYSGASASDLSGYAA